MDILGKLVQGTGCSADGTVAAQNPLSRALDGVIHSKSRSVGGPRGPGAQAAAPGPNAFQHEMQMQQQMHAGAGFDEQHQMLHAFEQEAMQRDIMNASNAHQVAFEAAFEEAKQDTFMNHPAQFARPPPGPAQFTTDPRQLQNRTQDAAWINEFDSMHLDNAWNHAQQSDQELAWEEAKMPPPMEEMLQQQDRLLVESETVGADQTERQMKTREVSDEMARTMSRNQDPKFQNSEFLSFMNQVSSGQIELDDEANEAKVRGRSGKLRPEGALEAAWDSSFDEGKVNRDMLENVWLADKQKDDLEEAFEEAASAPAEPAHLQDAWQDTFSVEEKSMEDAWKQEGEDLEALWEKAMEEAKAADPFEEAWGDQESTPQEYVYSADNPYLNQSDTFKKGVELFDAGRLNEAILAFEAEVQQSPENSEAWRLLGECHAENDEDKSAIICYERAIEEDPYNLPALLSLGVSNVNELNSHGALKNLKAWVEHNPKFHGLEIQVDEYSDGSLMDEVMQLMLQARAHDPTDSDVHVVLGVLYNVSKDFDAAVQSFQEAVKVRPDEYSLWNKLGATLANSSHSKDGIPAYHRALELKPRYARGWLNLGISHANLGNYEEAVKCYLQALNLNNRAEHIWSYLRIAFTCMERFDLVEGSDMRDLSLFREEFGLVDL